ncbi:MAG TPA: hypothetical protein DCG69_05395 [Bacteroidales bacterium]|nr:hypothetical protein [Bacteroidales bacterium]
MKKMLLLFILLVPVLTYSQDITGNWYWKSETGSNSLELEFFLENGELKGRHCGSFYDGLKIDCVDGPSSCSIILAQVKIGLYEGTIQSGFSLSSGRIQLTYNPVSNNILFKVLQVPAGEYYFPKECILIRN